LYRPFSAFVYANVAKLVDALDLGSSGETRGSSSLPIRTRILAFQRPSLALWHRTGMMRNCELCFCN
jgi:hypothetical protein